MPNIIEEIKQSNNPAIQELRQSNWLCVLPLTDEHCLYQDLRRSLLVNGQLLTADDNEQSFYAALQGKFSSLQIPFDTVYRYYTQMVSAGCISMLTTSLPTSALYPPIQTNYSTNLYVQNGICYCKSQLYDICIIIQKDRWYWTISVPGSVETLYQLTDQGYRLISVNPSNPLLKELCLGCYDVVITREKVLHAQREELKQLKNQVVQKQKELQDILIRFHDEYVSLKQLFEFILSSIDQKIRRSSQKNLCVFLEILSLMKEIVTHFDSCNQLNLSSSKIDDIFDQLKEKRKQKAQYLSQSLNALNLFCAEQNKLKLITERTIKRKVSVAKVLSSALNQGNLLYIFDYNLSSLLEFYSSLRPPPEQVFAFEQWFTQKKQELPNTQLTRWIYSTFRPLLKWIGYELLSKEDRHQLNLFRKATHNHLLQLRRQKKHHEEQIKTHRELIKLIQQQLKEMNDPHTLSLPEELRAYLKNRWIRRAQQSEKKTGYLLNRLIRFFITQPSEKKGKGIGAPPILQLYQ